MIVPELEVVACHRRVASHMPARDNQVRSADFLGVEHFPNITFTSSAVRNEQGHYFIDGDLTIRGTSRPATLSPPAMTRCC